MTFRDLAPSLVEGEPRIRDLDLAERLGFDQPRDIRKLIARHHGAVSRLGPLPKIAERRGRGPKSMTIYLNKRQAIFVTMKSETQAATEIAIEIIERFDAYERGLRPMTPLVVLDPSLPEFFALPLDERRERRQLIAETRQTVGLRGAHGLFERIVCRVRELGPMVEGRADIFDDDDLDRATAIVAGEVH